MPCGLLFQLQLTQVKDITTSPLVFTTSLVSTLHAIFVAELEKASAFQNF